MTESIVLVTIPEDECDEHPYKEQLTYLLEGMLKSRNKNNDFSKKK